MTFSTLASPGVSLQGGGGSGGGGGTPGGSNTQLQYNSSGAFAGAAGLTTDGTSLTITGGNLTMSGNISAPAWTTSGVRIKGVAATFTDTTSTGTVAAAYTDLFGGNTIAASNATTFTDYYTMFVSAATAGTNVTMTNKWALGLGGNLKFGPDASGTNQAGTNVTIGGSRGTGTGAGGSIVFQVAPAGSTGTAQNALATALTINSSRQAILEPGTAALPTLAWSNDATTGFYKSSTNIIDIAIGGAQSVRFSSNGMFFPLTNNSVVLSSGGRFAWSSGSAGVLADDVILARDAANTLALRNGTAAQRLNVYNTFTSSTNYEAFKIDWITTANTVLVGTEKGSGGGTARALALQTDGTTRMTVTTAGSVVVNTAALATNATDGFLYVPTCAGTPTGTPTTQTGTVPIVVDTTNNKLYFYSGAAWRDAGP